MKKVFLKYLAEKIDELLTKADEQMATKSDLTKKVDKVDGKGLSTNDYTTAEKTKLAGIQEGAQKNTVTSVRGALQLNPQVGNVVISAADIGLGNANTRLTSLENNKLDKSEKGATNGVASLDENGHVPSSQLPSYVDDVIDDLNYAQFPATGETGKIYIAKDTNKTYRWSGSGYAEISASLALGETEQTAYSGAKGKKNAEDIAKLADYLEETHQLASNAESAISEVVELTIPAIESDVANKATKSEAQGYATTAKTEAIAAAASDAQSKADAAESSAKTYADNIAKDYLPKSGGTITGNVSISSEGTLFTLLNNKGMIPYINFRSRINGVNTDLGDFGVDVDRNLKYYSNGAWRTIIHSGNIGSQTVNHAATAGNADSATNATKLGGVAADGYTQVLKGKTNVVNNHLYIGTLPASSGTTFDSLSIRGTIGGFGVIRRDFVDIAIGRRDGLQFGGLATFRNAGTSSYWDIAVNDAREVYILLYKQDCAYHIEVSSQQVTIEGIHGRTPTDTNWRYLREELKAFDNITSDTFTTSHYSDSQTTRRAQIYASGMKIFGSTTSGWVSGVTCCDADSISVGTIAGVYGEMSYTPRFFYYGGSFDNPIIKAYIGGAVEMKSTLTTNGEMVINGKTGRQVVNVKPRTATDCGGIIAYMSTSSPTSETGGVVFNGSSATYKYGVNALNIFNTCGDIHYEAATNYHHIFHNELKFKVVAEQDLCTGVRVAYKTSIAQVGSLIGNHFYLGKEATDKYIRFRKYTGISNAAPSGITDLMTIDTSGNAVLTGTMTATTTYHSSDERLKTFEDDIEVDLEKIKELPKKYFHWTADADGRRHLGTSAQAVREVFPELVSEDADGYLSVNYANLSVVALAAIDKLAEQNAELERRLAKIEKMLNIE